MELYIYASDEDHALELAGNGADVEFESAEQATKGFDADAHGSRKLFKISVEEVKFA